MATDNDRLKNSIKAAMVTAKQVTDPENGEAATDAFATALAAAITNEIKHATVTHIMALVSPSGAVSGTITSELL